MAERRLRGTAAAPGVAVGHIVRYTPVRLVLDREPLPAGEVDAELARLREAVAAVRDRITQAGEQARERAGESEAAIFEAHLLMLEDPALVGEAERRVRNEHQRAAVAIQETADGLRKQLEALEDQYLRARAADVADVASQLQRALAGGDSGAPDFPANSIIVADELLPSDTALFDPRKVVAFVTERGSRTAHVAILARAMEMPAIVGAAGVTEQAVDGEDAIVDGDWGELVLDPEPDTIAEFQGRLEDSRQQRLRRRATRNVPAITLDQQQVTLMANIGGPAEAEIALENGAQGIGLFRTEFLFLDRPQPPTEEEQYRAYRHVASVMGARPVVIRTLDVGGDKPVPGITLPPEDNPFLGIRGVRLSFRYPDLFRTQLRAILRAATEGNIWVMFPMVTTVDDVRDARRFLDEVADDLRARQIPHRADVPVGIMIEVPAAALAADRLIREVDFFSIGTNDLAQYTLAVDRSNSQLAQRYSPLDISVLRLIGEAVMAANATGKSVAVCGEMGGDPDAIPLLIGLGLRELSMTATGIAQAKEVIRGIRAEEAAATVQRLLDTNDTIEDS